MIAYKIFLWSCLCLKFIYSEKATKFCEISIVDLTVTIKDKSTVEISQKFVVFSEYINFSSQRYIKLCTIELEIPQTHRFSKECRSPLNFIMYLFQGGFIIFRKARTGPKAHRNFRIEIKALDIYLVSSVVPSAINDSPAKSPRTILSSWAALPP